MEKDLILQNLCDAFEVLKDSWDSKSEAICKCIAETTKHDADTALDMWQYLLQIHKNEWKSNDGAKVVADVNQKLRDTFDDFRDQASCISPVLMNKPELYKIIYGEMLITNNYFQTSFLTESFAWMLTEKRPDILLEILYLFNNNTLKDFSIGSFFSKCIENYKSYLYRFDVSVSDENKEILMSFLENIKDRKERAECMVAILSL